MSFDGVVGLQASDDNTLPYVIDQVGRDASAEIIGPARNFLEDVLHPHKHSYR